LVRSSSLASDLPANEIIDGQWPLGNSMPRRQDDSIRFLSLHDPLQQPMASQD
jgi:hypothetical protein